MLALRLIMAQLQNNLQTLGLSPEQVLKDYQLAFQSRTASIIGRKEVFAGKAKFGIFGDGKELAQIALAKVFQPGDFRSGYYRDQTLMMAMEALSVSQYFAQLYAHADPIAEPASGGRMMNCHFGTRLLNGDGTWKDLSALKNSSSDVSPLAAQMPRLLGLAYASKLYRHNERLHSMTQFSQKGNEIAFGTIGDASVAEGLFFETINAACVLQVPMLTSVWDDGYGISVPKAYQVAKADISKALQGLQHTQEEPGLEIITVKGWDYLALCQAYQKASETCRSEHVPVLVHVDELTQPQGHSTSGSHERYKSKERLKWEQEHDCIVQMRQWILKEKLASPEQLDALEKETKAYVEAEKAKAWEAFMFEHRHAQKEAINILSDAMDCDPSYAIAIKPILANLQRVASPTFYHAVRAVRQSLFHLSKAPYLVKKPLLVWLEQKKRLAHTRYNSHLWSESTEALEKVPSVPADVDDRSPKVNGNEIIQACFDAILERDPRVFIIGEDVGYLGGVNQGLAGLQKKYGVHAVTDTGDRECTIVGQGIGAALRGLRPIVEIQYLDYLPYALQILSDDLASLRYRTAGGQKSPVIVRTRGHRLEGIWHSGSYMAAIIHQVRGISVLVPRNMTQAAGFYNTLLQSDDPGIVIECLNGYRLKESMPNNLSTFTVPVGVPEILRQGSDLTVITYGAMCKIVMEAAKLLEEVDISCEVIDVQSLLPFDTHHSIVDSLQKTNRLVLADEDVPGGTTAYMMQEILENQKGFEYLDTPPLTITSHPHRPAYGDDGDYFSKPNIEDVYEKIYSMMASCQPAFFPPLDS